MKQVGGLFWSLNLLNSRRIREHIGDNHGGPWSPFRAASQYSSGAIGRTSSVLLIRPSQDFPSDRDGQEDLRKPTGEQGQVGALGGFSFRNSGSWQTGSLRDLLSSTDFCGSLWWM